MSEHAVKPTFGVFKRLYSNTAAHPAARATAAPATTLLSGAIMLMGLLGGFNAMPDECLNQPEGCTKRQHNTASRRREWFSPVSLPLINDLLNLQPEKQRRLLKIQRTVHRYTDVLGPLRSECYAMTMWSHAADMCPTTGSETADLMA